MTRILDSISLPTSYDGVSRAAGRLSTPRLSRIHVARCAVSGLGRGMERGFGVVIRLRQWTISIECGMQVFVVITGLILCLSHMIFFPEVRQEGLSALWRGTNVGLALAIPTVGIYLPCSDIFCHRLEEITSRNAPGLTPYVPLVAGSLSRSLACISCYPVELAKTRMQVFKVFNNTSENEHNVSTRTHKSEKMAARVVASTMTAVVAAGVKQKEKAAKDLQSLHSSPCKWFVCDDSTIYTRFFVIQEHFDEHCITSKEKGGLAIPFLC
ncbi:mitochondrial carrier protein mtm1 [Phtheirospermum japonicum]|uniref:Mitochondrial carrier protein mtm1 n=1 Tax=Phtheirospermum japonicum TaxID=374723 RepID=A0A830BMV2_9LAMI|nr:mitochondrial carrier protein mtm1 [Phtheirospermum japonicum]